MDRLEKLRNDVYSFAELDTLEKNAKKLDDLETLDLIAISRLSKTAKGEQPQKAKDSDGDETPPSRRARRGKT
jgi:hypothetical protein